MDSALGNSTTGATFEVAMLWCVQFNGQPNQPCTTNRTLPEHGNNDSVYTAKERAKKRERDRPIKQTIDSSLDDLIHKAQRVCAHAASTHRQTFILVVFLLLLFTLFNWNWKFIPFFCVVVVVVVCCVRYSAFVSASSLPVLCWNKNKKNAVAACNQCVMCLNAITHVIFLMTWPTFNAARCCWWIIME